MVDPRIESILKVDVEITSTDIIMEGRVNATVYASQRAILKLKGVYNDI